MEKIFKVLEIISMVLLIALSLVFVIFGGKIQINGVF